MQVNTKIAITTLGTIAASLISIFQLYKYLNEEMHSYIEQQVRIHSSPLINKRIYVVADSILHENKSLEESIAKELGVDKEIVYIKLSDLIKKDERYKQVGLMIYKQRHTLHYTHIDGTMYRPFLDHNTGYYFFYNHNGDSDWCK